MIKKKQQEKAIELKNVAITYKERKSFFKSTEYQALKDVSFDVYKGEVLGVIGRNGAGKSTLFRILAGIIKPDAGKCIHHVNSVSLMALAAGFDPNLSGLQNTIISGMLMGYSKFEILRKLEEIKNFSELQGFFEKPTKSYSSGMRARLAFSIAMYVSPDVLLIDEVLGVGDANFKKKAEDALFEKLSTNITVIIVSHSEFQIKRLANRVVWIEDGVVLRDGPADEVFVEYNLQPVLKKLGVKVDYFKINNNFLFQLESLVANLERLNVDCIIVDKLDRNINSVFYKTKHEHYQIQGPYPTPGIGNIHSGIKQAMTARYKNLCFYTGVGFELYTTLNNKRLKILEAKFSEI